MPEPDPQLAAFRALRKDRDDASTRAHSALVDLIGLKRAAERKQRDRSERESPNRRARDPHDQEDICGAASEARERGAAAAAIDSRLASAIDAYIRDQSPEALTARLDPTTPVLLLPLRVETRWREDELLVRVFPDEIAVETHETLLTAKEKDAGEAYWLSFTQAPDDAGRKAAWWGLVRQLGASRAQWVALSTAPVNAGAGGDPEFPKHPTVKEDSWTQPPRVNVLPDRLELLLLRGGEVVEHVPGRPIADVVHAGPAPIADEDGNASWDRDADGRILFDAKSAWLKEFDVAEAEGLAFRVGLDADAPDSFDELIVLGVKYSAGEIDGARLFGKLLEAHRYSPKGLAIVRQGTATNNTSDEDSGLDRSDWFADESYRLWTKAGADLPADPIDLATASDGERIELYLGLPRGLLSGVQNSDALDHVEAVAMNTALYPATLGFFLRTMLAEVVPESNLGHVRELFTQWVSGRGPLAALRVGPQPYGILLAGAPPRGLDQAAAAAGIAFDRRVEAVLAKARPFWEQFLPVLPRIGSSADPGKDLLAVLGLHPTTEDYYQRIAASYDHLSSLAQFKSGGSLFDEAQRQLFEGWVADAMLYEFGSSRKRDDGSPKPYPLLLQLIHAGIPTRIPTLQLVDGLPFAEDREIKPYDEAAGRNYIDWLAANARNADVLRDENFGAAKAPTSLLYMMLRHALLIQSSVSASHFLKTQGIDASELVTSRKFVGMTKVPELTAWEILGAPASSVKSEIRSDLALISHIHDRIFQTGEEADVGTPLADLLRAYELLARLPTARLERLVAEHIDTLSYRLDAWETGLLDKRLATRRLAEPQDEEAPPGGLYIGAVGYLEQVRRPAKPSRTKLPDDSLPEALQEGKDNLYRPEESGGRLHVPSLNHAIAGAVLKSGYLSHASASEPGPLAVNLSSRRVRRAAELLEGLRHGQPLEVLLGIEFERVLHDVTTRKTGAVILNQFKPALRAAFPIERMKTPPAGHPDEKPEIVPDFSVVNGLSIAAAPDSFPTGVAGLGPLDGNQQRELGLAREAVRSSLDALKDAITAESAYQLALGNFDRSAALVQAMAQPIAAPELEVMRSSRGTDLSFTQRATIQFDPAATNAWPGAVGLRAMAEPPINSWLAGLLPSPATISCKVDFKDVNGVVTHATSASAAALKLQPIDLLALGRRAGSSGASSELEERVREAARAASGAPASATAEIRFVEADAASDMSFAEALSLLDLVHQVLSAARPLDGRDGLTHGKKLSDGTDPTGLDIPELEGRVDALIGDVETLRTAIATAATDPARESALRAASDAGIELAFSLPGAASAGTRAASVATQLKAQLDAAKASRTAADAFDSAAAAEALIAAARTLLGADFTMLPRYQHPDAAEVAAADAASGAILAFAKAPAPASEPVDEVLTSIAQVRPAMHRVHRLRLMHELLKGTPLELSALQLPPRSNDVWLGAALPANHAIYSDTLSLLQFRPQGFSAVGAQCGLLVDEWVEVLPRTHEVTGMAFNYDQPNSAPLQTLLLAVSRGGRQGWSWAELIASIRDGVHRAKLRGVEPDMLDEVPGLTTFVPATMAEFTTSKGALSLDFGLASSIVLSQAVASGYFEPLTVGG